MQADWLGGESESRQSVREGRTGISQEAQSFPPTGAADEFRDVCTEYCDRSRAPALLQKYH